MESTITQFYGDEKLQAVDITHIPSGSVERRLIDGVFIFIGYVPNTEKFEGLINMNQWGEIVVDSDLKTSIDGVYAAGDSIAKRYRQVTTAVADGTIAALAASHYLNELKKKRQSELFVV